MTERELLQKNRRGAIQQRPPHALGTSDDVDQTSFEQRLEHAPHSHASDLFDLGPPDRLAIRDDGERLERRTRQTVWASRKLCALDGFGVFRSREDLPAAADVDQFDAVTGRVVGLAQLIECGLQRRWRCIRIECGKLVERDRASAREERGFKQPG